MRLWRVIFLLARSSGLSVILIVVHLASDDSTDGAVVAFGGSSGANSASGLDLSRW